MAGSEVFGTTEAGEAVRRVTLSGGGLTARIITLGATIQDLRLDGHAAPLVLGFERLEDYERHSPYFGATPGRCANRIAHGRFSIDGVDYQLECNERGVTHLHGGSTGMAQQNWSIVDQGSDHVTLEVVDPDGRAGYPGNCVIRATYALKAEGVLSVVYESSADRATIANVCQHSYFNLDGRDDILGHDLMIAADHYLPVDQDLIPTGEVRAVAGTAFDFRSAAPIARKEVGKQLPFDHNFCLTRERGVKHSIALVRSINSGVAMEVRTTEPGVQFYAGVYLDVPVPGLEGRTYGPYAGFCLETQIWPDAVNHPGFPAAILRPGMVLRQETDYVFTKS